MSQWFDRAMEDLEQQLADGLITNEEYWQQERELRWQLRDEAEEAAEEARRNVYGW